MSKMKNNTNETSKHKKTNHRNVFGSVSVLDGSYITYNLGMYFMYFMYFMCFMCFMEY